MEKIKDLEALEILDSRGNPTIQATIVTESGIVAKAAVPSGASTGEFEAVELRDGDKKRFFGRGVLRAVDAVRGPLKKLLIGQDVLDQRHIDELMITADGTPNKERLGANAILSVSLASARAAALAMKMPLFRSLGEGAVLPCPMMNVINGGVHADSGLDFQEFMIRPKGFSNFADALRAGVELFHTLKASLKKRGLSTSVGDEGGFAPNFSSHEEALDSIVAAIQALGYTPGKEISLALDCAASELYDKETKKYVEKKRRACGEKYAARSAEEQVAYLETLVKNYPIDSIEDGLSEHDWDGWKQLMDALGDKIQIVGDDIFVTNMQFLERGVKEKVANAILIKLNQIGTLTETMDTIQYAKENGFNIIISHRSGETEDNFIADLAVAVSSGQIKTGAPSRSDRVSKYNRLLEIEKELGSAAVYRQ